MTADRDLHHVRRPGRPRRIRIEPHRRTRRRPLVHRPQRSNTIGRITVDGTLDRVPDPRRRDRTQQHRHRPRRQPLDRLHRLPRNRRPRTHHPHHTQPTSCASGPHRSRRETSDGTGPTGPTGRPVPGPPGPHRTARSSAGPIAARRHADGAHRPDRPAPAPSPDRPARLGADPPARRPRSRRRPRLAPPPPSRGPITDHARGCRGAPSPRFDRARFRGSERRRHPCLTVTEVSSTAHGARSTRRRTLIAVGSHTFRTAGTARVMIHMTAVRAAALMRSHRHFMLTIARPVRPRPVARASPPAATFAERLGLGARLRGATPRSPARSCGGRAPRRGPSRRRRPRGRPRAACARRRWPP